ncbi:MAG: glycosyltransferase [Ignavibacteriales bacterium]|nr:glycosyltransferase [Ignavibacteriales bacterium]
MKSIFLYSPYWGTFGGGEKYLLGIAEALSENPVHDATIVSSDASISKMQLEKFSHIDLSKVHFKHAARMSDVPEVVGDADCFIFQSNVRKIVTRARSHVQIIQIPYREITPLSVATKVCRGQIREGGKDILRLRLMSFARRQASVVLVYSQFVQDILKRNYDIESCILYPPIQDLYEPGISKKNIILSVGRFFKGLYNNKRYDVLTAAFRMLYDAGLHDWEYHLVGSASTDSDSREMIRQLEVDNKNYPVIFHVNESFDTMRRMYNEATIFWHGAGYGIDEERNPENAEHFGMTTVEAMSARCIPVVIAKGGQREIITHGMNGFLWDTIDDLMKLSTRIIHGEVDISVGERARNRFHDFVYPVFRKRVNEIITIENLKKRNINEII